MAAVLGATSADLKANENPDIAQGASTPSPAQSPQGVSSNEGKKPLRLGLIIAIRSDPEAAIAKIHDLGLPTCQVSVSDFDQDQVGLLKQALAKYRIEATSLVASGPGRETYNFYQGPLTIGFVPSETRAARIAQIKSVRLRRAVRHPCRADTLRFHPRESQRPCL